MKTLFDQTMLSTMQLKNRIFRGALWESLADEKGHLTAPLEQIYRELAQGGAGTIITGYAFVTEGEQPNPGMMGVYDDSFLEEYRSLTDMVHRHGANIIMQIAYGGSLTQFNVGERTIWSPSGLTAESMGTGSREISKEEILDLVESYAAAALRVKKAGFDGVEIHGAHGYFLSQFLSPNHNRRTDEYGGSLENRCRIFFEVYRAVRESVGLDFPVLIKINAQDFAGETGTTEEDSIFLAMRLAEMGIDAIEVSGGDETQRSVQEQNLGPARKMPSRSREKESYFRDFATRLAELIAIPVILIGGNRHPEVMEELLNSTRIAYFSLARPLTAEPDLVNIWARGDRKSSKCVSCNRCYTTPGKRCVLNISKANAKT